MLREACEALIEGTDTACRADVRAGVEAMATADFDGALARFRAAQAHDGDGPVVPYCLALLHVQRGMITTALDCFVEALGRKPLLFACQRDFVATLREVDVLYRPLLTDRLRQVVVTCFRTPRLNHQALLPLALALVRQHGAEPRDDELVHLLLSRCYLTDVEAERFFTRCRRSLLLREQHDHRALVEALAAQGRNNGFIWAVSAEERSRLRALRARKDRAASTLLAMYAEVAGPPAVAPVVRGARIEDRVSRRMQRQYDRFPYPAWTDLLLPSAEPPSRHPQGDVLVAGCGTGRHALQLAARFPGVVVDAEDVSLRSLRYGAAKAKEFGLSNVRFIQADSFRPASCDRRYASIECVGTLHHTRDPSAALHRLHGRLKAGGRMKLGLYSRRARAFIERVKNAHLGGDRPVRTIDGLRTCRQRLLSRPPDPDLQRVFRLADFHYAAGVKDLLFHEVESDFSLPEIGRMLERLGLSFLGFEVPPVTAAAFRRSFPASTGDDLLQWDEFERDRPDSFLEMYVFWCEDARAAPLR